MTNGGGGAFRTVCFRIQAMMIATAIPRPYMARIITAPNEMKPRTFRPAKKAAITRV